MVNEIPNCLCVSTKILLVQQIVRKDHLLLFHELWIK